MKNDLGEDELIQGLSALRLGLVPADRFFQVLKQWLDDRSIGLLSRFETEGLLNSDQRGMLLGTVAQLKEKFANDLTQVFAVVAPGSSAGEILEEIRSLDPFATVLPARAGMAGGGQGEGLSRPSGPRFQILRPHAEGGLGKVSLAHDREVNRPVAFKEIKPQFADNRQSQEQFLLEAQLTGGLEHPGIVPIYGLGHHPDGRPFYAMRFITGDSLQNAIEKFHTADGLVRDQLKLSDGERMLEFRQLLGRFVDVCQAIAYAHHRGVLHRDLKPGNIMVGKYSETLVIDWGLAKLSGPESASRGLNVAVDQPLLTSGSMAPSSGPSISGTPSYMSPEQARGDLAALGPASDIYSLGATFYCLLTGQAPQNKKVGLAEVLSRVSRSEFDSPLSVKPDIPKALNAICLHAMASKAEDRYTNAQLLSDDIERWLADEPIDVFREPLVTRASRWARKNRIKVSLGLGALVTGLVAAVIGVFLVSAEQARTETQRARAELLFLQAREAVDDYLINVTDNEQLKSQSLQPTRISLLQDGLKYYQKFLSEKEASDELKVPRAKALLRLAKIHKEIGSLEDAEKTYLLAFAECESIFASPLRAPGLKIEYALGYLELGDIQLASTTRRDASLVSLQKAEEIITSSRSEENPDSVDASLSSVFAKLGMWFKSSDISKAIDYARQAMELRSKLASRPTASRREKVAWAKSLFDAAILLGETRNYMEATQLLIQARDIWQGMSNQVEMRREALESESSISHELAILSDQLGDSDKALEASSAALKSRTEVAFSNGQYDFQQLSQTYNDHGLRLIRANSDRVQGEELLQRSLWLRKELVVASPLSSENVVRFAESTNNICKDLLKRSELANAETLLIQAKKIFEACPVPTLETPGVSKYRAATELLIGQLRQLQGDPIAADVAMNQAVQWQTILVEADPKNHEYLLALMLSYGTIGGVKLKLNDFDSAIEYFNKAAATSEKIVLLSPEDIQGRLNHSAFVFNTAVAMRRASQPIEGVRTKLLEAIELTLKVLAINMNFASARKVLLAQFTQLIDTCRTGEGLEDLVSVVTKSATIDSWSGAELVELSKRICAILMRDPADEERLDASQLKFAEAIVGILKVAKERDPNAQTLVSIPELNVLRSLDSFKELFPEVR